MPIVNLALITLAEDADPARVAVRLRARTIDADDALVGETIKPNLSGGDLIWRLAFPDRDAWGAADLSLAGEPGVAHVDWAAFEPIGGGRRGDGSVYRQMTMHVDRLDAAAVARFEQDTLLLADHVPEILQWTLGRVFAAGGDRPWTHVWEQRFARAEDFTGPYMSHPWHWGVVDRWFDPEMPERIVDRRLCNSLCRVLAPRVPE